MKKTSKIARIELFCLAWIQLCRAYHFFPSIKSLNIVMILFIILSIPIYIYGIYTFMKEKNKQELIFSIVFFILFMVHVAFFFHDLL